MTASTEPLIGTTLYSFTNEWVSGQFSLDELLERVAGEKIGPGVELVGFQSIRGYPNLPSAFVDEFRETTERLGLTPTSLGTNIDVALRRDRYLSTEERVDYLLPQIEAARTLGFPVARIQIGADPEVLERVAPAAERAGVRLGMEIHAPEGPHTKLIEQVYSAYEKIGSEYLGFIPDFSSTMHGITDGLIRNLIANGMLEALVPTLREIWATSAGPGDRLARFREIAARANVPASAMKIIGSAFTMNGHEDPAGWADLMPRVFHVHAKFYEISDAGEEPAIDYTANLAPLLRAGFAGSISSEWEGHAWTPNEDLDTFAVIRKQHALIQRVIAETLA